MSNLIGGLIAVLLVLAFLGFYAVSLRSLPLWIIIVAVLALVMVDFFQSVRKDKD